MIEIATDPYGVEIVTMEREDGSFVSMPKAIWDEQQAQKELGGTL